MFRLHIDVPVGTDQEKATEISKKILAAIIPDMTTECRSLGINLIQYRLGNDSDRQRSNYLDRNENGHCSSKKTRVEIEGFGG